MIVINTSAVLAILQGEPESSAFVTLLQAAERRLMSAATYVECAMVTQSRRGTRGHFDLWLEELAIEVVPVDFRQARTAADAFAEYGRGRHAARLNFGDCFVYALAIEFNAPLLYKGADFGKTDLQSVTVPET